MSLLEAVECRKCGAALQLRDGTAKCGYCGTVWRDAAPQRGAGASASTAVATELSEAGVLAAARRMLFGRGTGGVWFGRHFDEDVQAHVAAVYGERLAPDEPVVLLADASEDEDASASFVLTPRALHFTDADGEVRSVAWSSLGPEQIQTRGGELRVGGHVVDAADYYRGNLDVAGLLRHACQAFATPPRGDQLEAATLSVFDRVTRLPDSGVEVHPGIRPSQRAHAREVFSQYLTDAAPPLVIVEDALDDDEWAIRLIVTLEGVCWQNDDEDPQALAWSEIDPRGVELDTDEDEDSPWLLHLGEDHQVVFQTYDAYVEALVPFVTTFAALAHGEDPSEYLSAAQDEDADEDADDEDEDGDADDEDEDEDEDADEEDEDED